MEKEMSSIEKNEKVLERLDQYRAKEIDALWQRSVFLGTFLVLGYTGYGVLINNILFRSSEADLNLPHLVACALACVNIIFSVLWIAMAKGSKAWYEVYENAIQEMELKVDKSYSEVRKSIRLKFAQKNDCLFSTKAGGYSPSKINIVLGQISLVIWSVVLLVHLIVLYCNDFESACCKCLVCNVIIFIIVIIFVVICFSLKNHIKSSCFSDETNVSYKISGTNTNSSSNDCFTSQGLNNGNAYHEVFIRSKEELFNKYGHILTDDQLNVLLKVEINKGKTLKNLFISKKDKSFESWVTPRFIELFDIDINKVNKNLKRVDEELEKRFRNMINNKE